MSRAKRVIALMDPPANKVKKRKAPARKGEWLIRKLSFRRRFGGDLTLCSLQKPALGIRGQGGGIGAACPVRTARFGEDEVTSAKKNWERG